MKQRPGRTRPVIAGATVAPQATPQEADAIAATIQVLGDHVEHMLETTTGPIAVALMIYRGSDCPSGRLVIHVLPPDVARERTSRPVDGSN